MSNGGSSSNSSSSSGGGGGSSNIHEIKIGGGKTPHHHHGRSRDNVMFVMVLGILLLSFVQMAMQLYIFDNVKKTVNELENVDIKSGQLTKTRDAQILAVLHNQDQIETAANATLAKLLRTEAAGR